MVEAQGEGIGIGVTTADAPAVTIYAHVDDLQAVLDQVAALGGKTVQEITTIPGMVTMATFADPVGNIVGLVAAETPRRSRSEAGRRGAGPRRALDGP